MSLMWVIYLADVVGSIGFIGGITITIVIFVSIIITIGILSDSIKIKDIIHLKKIAKYFLILVGFLAVLPSEKTIYLMLGANIIENVAEDVSKSPIYSDIMDILQLKIKDIKQELDQEEKK